MFHFILVYLIPFLFLILFYIYYPRNLLFFYTYVIFCLRIYILINQ